MRKLLVAIALTSAAVSTSSMIWAASAHADTQVRELNRQKLLADGFATTNGEVKVAFFDADSTLRVSLSGSVSANGPKDVMLLPFVAQKIAEVYEAGYLVMIVSNQAGIAQGHITMETADSALKYTADLIRAENPKAIVHYIDFAENKDDMRKPGKGMALLLEAKLKERGLSINWRESFMVGDSAYKKTDTKPDGTPGTHFSNADRLFAENLQIPFIEPNDFFGWRCHGVDVFDKAAQVADYLVTHSKRCD